MFKATNPEVLHESFKNHTSQPGYKFLCKMERKLEKSDFDYLSHNWDSNGRYLIFVKPYGTDAVRIGVHRKLEEYATAMLETSMRQHSLGCEILLVANGMMKVIDEARARKEIQTMDYLVTGNSVLRTTDNAVVASFVVETEQSQCRLGGKVRFGTPPDVSISHSLRIALRHVASCEMVLAWGTFFVHVDEVTINGDPILIS